jgi:pilus assembly protein Flp/PilA
MPLPARDLTATLDEFSPLTIHLGLHLVKRVFFGTGVWRIGASHHFTLHGRFREGAAHACHHSSEGVNLMRNITKFLKDESGASAAEYALILAIIAVAIVTAMTTLGTAITTAIDAAAGQI